MHAMWCRTFELPIIPTTHSFSRHNGRRRLPHRGTPSIAPVSLRLSCREPPRFLFPSLALPSGDIPSPSDANPPEVDDFDEEEESLTKFDKIWLKSEQARIQEEKYYKDNRAVFREAIGLDPDGEDEEEKDDDRQEAPEIIRLSDRQLTNEDGDFFSAVDAAVASLKSKERASKRAKGLLGIGGDYADKEERDDIDSDTIGKTVNLAESSYADLDAEEGEGEEEGAGDMEPEGEDEVETSGEVVEEEEDALADPSFDLDFTLEEDLDQIKEPVLCMTLSELLDEARIVPILVDGDQDVEITGIQYDSRQVTPGNMFICGLGTLTSEHSSLAEAVEKGAVVVVASMEVSVQESVKAVVVVENTTSILSTLSAAFYGNPAGKMSVVGICGSNGKASTSYLIKSMFVAMEKKTGLIGSLVNYVYGKKKSETLMTTLNAISLHKLLATMVHNGTETCVIEVPAVDDLQNLEFKIAVFTNFTSQSGNYQETEDKIKASMIQLFAKMIDRNQHAKVVNIDDQYAPQLIAQGSPDVPVVTFSMENREADVYTSEVQLSLFETDVLVHTPRGNLEISSGLLGRHNVYSILAAVAVGIAVNAPLELIVQGIEEVDAVPGRCELIDEEQAFAVIVDHARTPEGLSRLLDTVRECGARRLITVVGCEGECERGKRPVMAKVATDKSEVSILTSDNPRKEDPLYILDDMLAGVGWSMKEYLEHGERDYYPPLRNGHRLFLYDDRAIAVRAAVAMGEEGDAVIIAGKGHETFQLVGEKTEYLDDREECREALQHVDGLHAAGIDTSEFPWRLPESH